MLLVCNLWRNNIYIFDTTVFKKAVCKYKFTSVRWAVRNLIMNDKEKLQFQFEITIFESNL